MRPFKWTLLTLVVSLPALAATFADPKDLPAREELPDPLTAADGTKITSAAGWPARRAELLALIQHYQYGELPPPPKSVAVSLLTSATTRASASPHKQFKVTCDPGNGHDKVSFVVDILLPRGKGDGPFPAIVRGDWGWGKTAPDITELVLARGYALVEFNRTELAPDNATQTTGLHVAYPDADFGGIAAWAWGFHRTVDLLVTLPYIDKSKIAITGHSRGGKATLLAGATDERIALVNPNASGCGGAGAFRINNGKAETIKDITDKFPYWFTPRFKAFAGRESHLPFDQHSLKACVAPRALLCTEGVADLWANPAGSYATNQAAKPVFELLGAADKLAYHARPGPHQHNVEDWTALLDFADQVFVQKKSTRDWNTPPQAALSFDAKR